MKQIISFYHWSVSIMLPQNDTEEADHQQRVVHCNGGLEFVGVIDRVENHEIASREIVKSAVDILEREFGIPPNAPRDTVITAINFTGSRTIEIDEETQE